jgi:non-ribosomal peptide synthetase component F
VLLAAFQTLLMPGYTQDDIVVGVAAQSPEKDDAQEMNQGFGANVAIRTDISGDPSFRQLLARVNNDANGAREHQNVPWDRVVEVVQPDRDASRHPVFQVLFSLEDAQFSQASPDGGQTMRGQTMLVLDVDLRLLMHDGPTVSPAHFTYCRSV